jgi:hypothetical protein
MGGQQGCVEMAGASEQHSFAGSRRDPRGEAVFFVLQSGPDTSIQSARPGYIWEKQIAAYRETQRNHQTDAETAFQFVDLYV